MLIWNSFDKIYILTIKIICSFHVNFAFKVHVPFIDPCEKIKPPQSEEIKTKYTRKYINCINAIVVVFSKR